MISELDAFYVNKEEPTRGCLLALRELLHAFDENITETWTHRMPMFRYNGKLFCYLWIDKKTHQPYLGIYRGLEVEHPKLELGTRNKMKIIRFQADKDLPVRTIRTILKAARELYE